MARYQKVLPLIDSPDHTFGQIHQLLTKKGFHYENRDLEQVYRKGDGFWTAERFIKVLYFNNYVQVEAWLNTMGAEMDLDGFYGWAVKSSMRKLVASVEEILSRPGAGYMPKPTPAPAQQAPVTAAPQQVEEDERTVSAEYAQPQATAPAENVQPTFCGKCGTALVPGGRFCPRCAHPVGAPPVAPAQQTYIPAGISKHTYYKEYAGDNFKKSLRVAGILGYICAGINAVISILLAPIGLIESAIFLGLTLGAHLGKSKGCAIGMLVYSIFTVVLGLILNGAIGGWLWIIAGVNAVVVFSNADKRYKELTGTT